MVEEEYITVDPGVETFRGYAEALDKAINNDGGIAIPFIAFAKAAGADVDKLIKAEEFENFLLEAAAEYSAAIKKHRTHPGQF